MKYKEYTRLYAVDVNTPTIKSEGGGEIRLEK